MSKKSWKYAVEYRYKLTDERRVALFFWAQSYKGALSVMQEMLAGGWDCCGEKVLAARVLAWEVGRESSPKVIRKWKEKIEVSVPFTP